MKRKEKAKSYLVVSPHPEHVNFDCSYSSSLNFYFFFNLI